MGHFNRCVCLCNLDDKKDHRVVGHTLHSLLYTMLIHYRLAEATLLVELVLHLPDVRLLAAVYKKSDSSVPDILSSHSQV